MKRSFKKLIGLFVFPLLMSSCSGNEQKTYTKEDLGTFSLLRSAPKYSTKNNTRCYELACNCIAHDLHELGFTVKRGVVVVNEEEYVPGYIFTNNEVAYFDDASGYTIYNAGFLQIHDSSSPDDFLLTKEVIENKANKIVTVAEGSGEELYSYDLSIEAMIDSYSGIYNDQYFKYIQTDLHVVDVTVYENNPVLYDANIDLYSFEKSRYIFKANPTAKEKQQALALYSEEMVAYKLAVEAAQEIISWQDSNGTKSTVSTVLMIDQDLIEEYEKFGTTGKLDNFITDNLNSLNLKGNEFVSIDAEGNFSIQQAIYTDAYLKQKEFMGFVKAAAAIIAIASTVVMCAVAPAASGTFIVTAVKVLSVGTGLAIAVDNLAQGVQEIIYARNGDYTSEAKSLIKSAFEAIAGDSLGSTLYSGFIIASSALNLINGIAGLNLGQFTSQGFWYATGHIVRVLAVKAVETIITSAAVALSTTLVTNVIYTATGSPVVASITGAATGAVVGFACGFALDKLDRKFNISGLYSKQDIKAEIDDEDFKFKEVTDDDPNNSGNSGTPAAADVDPDDAISTEAFNNMTIDQKEYTYEGFVNKLSADLGLTEKPNVRFVTSTTLDPVTYDQSTNTFYINKYNINDVNLNTYTLSREMYVESTIETFEFQPREIQENLVQTSQAINRDNQSVINNQTSQNAHQNPSDYVPRGSTLDNNANDYANNAVNNLIDESELNF